MKWSLRQEVGCPHSANLNKQPTLPTIVPNVPTLPTILPTVPIVPIASIAFHTLNIAKEKMILIEKWAIG